MRSGSNRKTLRIQWARYQRRSSTRKCVGGDEPRDSDADGCVDGSTAETSEQTSQLPDGLASLMRAEREREASSISDSHSVTESAGPNSPTPSTDETVHSETLATAPQRDVFVIPETRTGHWASRVVAVAPESQFAVRFRHLAIRTRTDLASLRRSSLLGDERRFRRGQDNRFDQPRTGDVFDRFGIQGRTGGSRSSTCSDRRDVGV